MLLDIKLLRIARLTESAHPKVRVRLNGYAPPNIRVQLINSATQRSGARRKPHSDVSPAYNSGTVPGSSSPLGNQRSSQQEKERLPGRSSTLLWTVGGNCLSRMLLPNFYIQPLCIQSTYGLHTQEDQKDSQQILGQRIPDSHSQHGWMRLLRKLTEGPDNS